MIIVYTKEKEPREIFNTILTREEAEKSGGLFVDHPELTEKDCIVVEVERPFQNPISDDLRSIREMTREELILTKGKTELLQDGEKLQDGQIVKIEMPQSEYLTYVWDRQLFVWQLATTKEELMLKRKDLIIQYKDLKTEIETLQEFEEEFESDNTVELLKSKMTKIKEEINELLKVIKKM